MHFEKFNEKMHKEESFGRKENAFTMKKKPQHSENMQKAQNNIAQNIF